MDNYPKIIPVTPPYLEHWPVHEVVLKHSSRQGEVLEIIKRFSKLKHLL